MCFSCVQCQKLNSSSFLYLSRLFMYLFHYNSAHTLRLVLYMSPQTFIFLKLRPWSFALSDVTCKTAAQADIVLLVDGSWSIGRLNFKTIRSFIARMVQVFEIGPERVQIGGFNQN